MVRLGTGQKKALKELARRNGLEISAQARVFIVRGLEAAHISGEGAAG